MPRDVLSRADAVERARLLSDVAYDVSLDLTRDGDTFTSETVVRFACAERGASTFLNLVAAGVQRVELNGEALAAEVVDGSRVRLDGLAERNEVRVVADCAYSRTGVGLHRFVDPVDGRTYLHTQFEPFDAHRVYACFDQPDLKAPFALTVTASDDWVATSNSPGHNDGGVWRFEPTPPISTYITALVTGPFHRVTDTSGRIPLGLSCRQSLAEYLDADEMFEITKQGFEFFERAFDYPYMFGKYDQLFVPEFNAGAMENAGCVTFSEVYIFRSRVTDALRERRAETILHEMAHMWFGDLVTMRWWDDLWLNESFATYMAYLAAVEATRFTNAWASFTTGRKAWAYGQDQLPTTHPIVADMVDTDAVRTNFDGITYAKGASVLRQLVAWVGDDAFLEGLRGYFRRHAWSNATLADFLAALEDSSGRDLGAWSKEWLETAGVATLHADSAVSDDGAYADVAVVQDAPAEHPTLRAHRVGVGLYDVTDGQLARRRAVELDVVGARTEVPQLTGERVADLLLLNDADLTFAKIRLDARSLDTLARHLGDVADPVARGLCWHAAWDMTRDGELATRRFVGLVAEHVDGETDVGVLQTLLGQAEAAVDRYGDPSNRTSARAQLAGRARTALHATEPGGDFQLAWARFLVSVDDDLTFARGLLAGDVTVEGLRVDTDLRWHLVLTLAAAGDLEDEAIAAEAERDPTDMGARRAAAARAARPDAEAKGAAWHALLDDASLPLATQRAIAGSFHQPAQDALLLPYVDAYVDALEGIWGQRTPDEALTLTGGLYPSTIVDERVVAAADRALALEGLPPPGRRVVIEHRDATQRALRARAADVRGAGGLEPPDTPREAAR
jgi:aminopeptidase N